MPRPPAGPEERKRRRRRAALLGTAAALVAAGLLISSAWLLRDAMDGNRGRDRDFSVSASGTPDPADPRASASGAAAADGDASPDGSGAAAGSGTSGTSDAPSASAEGAAAEPTAPQVRGYSGVSVDAENSVSLSDGRSRKPSEGDIGFSCARAGCELESDTSVFVRMYGEPGATYDDCRLFTAHAKSHSLPLAAASAGTEICVRHRNGDIALLVVQVKSTAMPDLGFVMADLTVWRAEKG
ncbi:hypothetical protein G3I32_13925 [Streptomyces coelicoflavus]|uniref:Uncharacterized protein n=1 Tax=Streptomyces coelicoflavus TaxID=285562 RepID=A0A7K3PJ17_9ACTN|nr:hypothetical protein [Streptomyces coelicoflavus]